MMKIKKAEEEARIRKLRNNCQLLSSHVSFICPSGGGGEKRAFNGKQRLMPRPLRSVGIRQRERGREREKEREREWLTGMEDFSSPNLSDRSSPDSL